MILGFTGPARSGKDTAAEMAIVALYNIHKISRIEKYAFADPLKHAAAAMFGVDVKLMYSDDKDQIDPFWGISYREMLQKLGTEGGRQLFLMTYGFDAQNLNMIRLCKNLFILNHHITYL